MTTRSGSATERNYAVVDLDRHWQPVPERARQRQAFEVFDGVPANLDPPWLRLTRYSHQFKQVTRSVGQVRIAGRPAGTGFVVAPRLVITNRHVADQLATSGSNNEWRLNGSESVIDFAEFPSADTTMSQYDLQAVRYMATGKGADFALLSFAGSSREARPAPPPLDLYDGQAPSPRTDRLIYLVGYPFEPDAATDPDLQFEIFGSSYGAKRVQPGRLLAPADNDLSYDSSTLRGNSGSPVVLLSSGQIAGIHYTGDRRGNTALSLWRSEEFMDAMSTALHSHADAV